MTAKRAVELMVDSGAFTMWNRGIVLDVRNYIDWLKDHHTLLCSYVVLDIIPGTFGSKLTQREIDASGSGSYKHQQKMKDAGLKPIPVFHQGEDFAWLERYLREESYIGVGTNKATPESDQTDWLDKVFTALTDDKGRPLARVHGFGITRPSLLMRYPWFSTDSTTWTLTPSFGQLWIPQFKDGKPDYSTLPSQVIMSDLDIERKARNRLLDEMGPLTKAAVLQWLDYCGFTLEEARYDPNMRRRIMLRWFLEFQDYYKIPPFAHRGGSLTAPIFKQVRPPKQWQRLQIHLATNLSRNWARMMCEMQAAFRLLNYHELRERPTEDLVAYVTKGSVGEPRASGIRPDWRARYTSHRRLKLVERIGEDDGQD